MPLLVNVRHLEKGPLTVEGDVSVAELELESKDDLIRFSAPVNYRLDVQLLEQALLVQGVISVSVNCECARCLQAYTQEIGVEDWVIHVPLSGDSAVPVEGDCVDLTPFLREDILLALPQHPLCSTDCQGLLREYGREARTPSDGEDGEEGSSPWTELDKLDL